MEGRVQIKQAQPGKHLNVASHPSRNLPMLGWSWSLGGVLYVLIDFGLTGPRVRFLSCEQVFGFIYAWMHATHAGLSTLPWHAPIYV